MHEWLLAKQRRVGFCAGGSILSFYCGGALTEKIQIFDGSFVLLLQQWIHWILTKIFSKAEKSRFHFRRQQNIGFRAADFSGVWSRDWKFSELSYTLFIFGAVNVRSCETTPSVRVVFCIWPIELTRVMRKVPHSGVGIVWGAIPSVLPVFQNSVSGYSWDNHGTSPNLWVQKKLVKFWQGTQDTWLCFSKFLREFLGYSPLDLLGDLRDVIVSYLRVKYVLWSTAPTAFRCFSRNCC